MAIHLRQIALVAEQLEPALIDITSVLGINRCYVDPAVSIWGLENTLVTVGSDFLEVVAPTVAGTAAGRYLSRRGGDGGYMVITQTDNEQNQALYKARANAQGVRVAYERADAEYHLMQLHPADMRASFLEIDSDKTGDFSGYWHPAGGLGWEGSIDTTRTLALIGAQLQGPDPDSLARHWAAVLGEPVTSVRGGPGVQVGNATLRFSAATDGRGPGLGGVDLAVTDIAAVQRAAHDRHLPLGENYVTLCGTRFYLHEHSSA